MAERFDAIIIGTGQSGPSLAEAAVHLGELQPDVAPADDHQMLGQEVDLRAGGVHPHMYSKGRGVVQNYVQAHMWYNLAAAQGNETARENRDIVAESMMPADISKAQVLAREWMEKHQ